MKTVYRYKVYDINSDTEIVAATYAPKEFIEKIDGAKILSETELHIDDDQLDGNGKHTVSSIRDIKAND
jgi:hypothetical protein